MADKSRIEWKVTKLGGPALVGSVNGLRLFDINHGFIRNDTPWSLRTRLPISSSRLGQVHKTPDDAKAAAEALLKGFVRRIGATFEEDSDG